MNPPEKFSIIVGPDEAKSRLDKFVQLKIEHSSRSQIQNAIVKGNITVNGERVKTGYNLKAGELVNIEMPEPEAPDILPENIPLIIIFEDEDVLVVNKPAGLVVHPGAGNFSGTLVNALLHHCKSLSSNNGSQRPGIVHRLDKNTSGLMVVAKNDEAHRKIAAQFDTREISRTYEALVWGKPAESKGEIETLIDRGFRDRKKMTVSKNRGKLAVTTYQLITDYQYISELRLSLKTGRTHQIRVHMNFINHPVFGDPDYNGRESQLNRLPAELKKRGMALLKMIDRQALHAAELKFLHPKSGEEVCFKAPAPQDYIDLKEKIPRSFFLD